MSRADPIYDLLEQRLAGWAEERPDIYAVLVVGSRARPSHPADAFSDLDTILFVENAGRWVEDTGWQAGLEAALGLPVWFTAYALTGGTGDPEWELVLAGGRKVDLVVCTNQAGAQAELGDIITASPYGFVTERGARVLFNRQPGPLPNFAATLPEQTLPTASEFTNQISNALLELVRAARMTQRGEYWRAAHVINDKFQEDVLTLLEWQARSARPPRAAWHYGRFVEEWAEPDMLDLLPGAAARPTLGSIQAALLSGVQLLGRLAAATAEQLGYDCPEAAVQAVTTWLRETLDPRAAHSPAGKA